MSGLVPRLRIRPGRLGADPAGIAARADTLEVGDAIEDRPVEIGQVFGKRGDRLDGLGNGWGGPGLHHPRRWATRGSAGTGHSSRSAEAKVPNDRGSVPARTGWPRTVVNRSP